jgi:hypothetical protein
MKLTTSLGAVTCLFLAWVVGCGDDSNGSSPGGVGGAADGGEPAAGGAPSTAGTSTGGSTSAGAQNVAGDASSAGAGGAGTETPCVLAADWEIVDEYVYPGANATFPVSLAADPSGNLFVFGIGRGVGMPGMMMPKGALRRSTDGGATWTDVPFNLGAPGDATADDAGNIYVTLGGQDSVAIYKSENQGDSFEMLHTFPRPAGAVNDPCNTGFIAAGAGGVLVAGASCDNADWTVVKSQDGGENWDTVVTFKYTPGKPARMQDVGMDQDGLAYAIGRGADAADAIHWLTVREGEPAGVVSDDFELVPNLHSEPVGFVGSGTPMVAGVAADENTPVQGIVRRMTGPDTWETIDHFPGRAQDVEAVGDTIIITGEIEDETSVITVTRRSDDAGVTFAPIGEFSYIAGFDTRAGKLGSDPAGSFYSLNTGHDENDVPHWIVRKLACE